MATVPVQGVNDGARLTVNQMIRQPTIVPKRMIRMLDQQFITNAVLRNAGAVPSGVLVYNESTPLFAEDDPQVYEEFAEIPATSVKLGQEKVAKSVYKGLAIKISERMRTRNRVDLVNTQMTQVRNSFVRHYEDTFLSLFLSNPNVPTQAASGDWGSAATRVRDDLADGILAVQEAAVDDAPEDFLGFDPDTLILSNQTATAFLKNDDIAKVFQGNIADENFQYRGTMPGNFYGLRIVKSRRLDPSKAILLERNTVGGISDERALRATPLYEDRPRETWRSDITRASLMFVDQPKAALIFTGINTP
jgi:hypothetical protein